MEKRHYSVKFIICTVLLIIMMAAGIYVWTERATAESFADQAESIKDTVYKRALQCYVIEGSYPESLDYLEENYGLTVNKEDFKVMYTPFAENLPPDVRVLARS